MATYIALLRGINVGGSNKLKLEKIKTFFESLGFTGVSIYIQSGNIIFQSPKSGADGLVMMIEGKIKKAFTMDVSVLVRTKDELGQIIDRNPFLPSRADQVDKLHVTFLSDLPDKNAIDTLGIAKGDDEDFKIIGREIYLFCPNSYGRTRLTNNAFEAKLSVRATTRNWKTVNALYEMARK